MFKSRYVQRDDIEFAKCVVFFCFFLIALAKQMAGPGATSYGAGIGNSPSSNYSSYGSTSCNNPWAETDPIRGRPGGGFGSCITASGLGGWGTDSMTLAAMPGP